MGPQCLAGHAENWHLFCRGIFDIYPQWLMCNRKSANVHSASTNATYDCVIKARPDLDYLPGAGAALLRACADPRARRRPVMQTFKDDRLFALQRPALERIVAMHDRTIESGRCAGAPGTAACVGLMQEYCRSQMGSARAVLAQPGLWGRN